MPLWVADEVVGVVDGTAVVVRLDNVPNHSSPCILEVHMEFVKFILSDDKPLIMN
jgi:hypothetical protein